MFPSCGTGSKLWELRVVPYEDGGAGTDIIYKTKEETKKKLSEIKKGVPASESRKAKLKQFWANKTPEERSYNRTVIIDIVAAK